MEEGDWALGAAARGAVDELDALDPEPGERGGEVRDLEADVVEPLPLRGEEASNAGRLVGRAHELDLRVANGEERDSHPVGGDVLDRLELETERVAIELQRALEVPDHHSNVVDAADGTNRGRQRARRIVAWRGAHTVMSSRGSPHAGRRRLLISPTVA